MKKFFAAALIAACAACATCATAPALATVSVASVDGSAPFGTPATFQFDAPTPAYSGTIYSGSTGTRAQPSGSTGGYAAVGPGNTETSATLDLSSFGLISSITFLWGSIDTFNVLDVLGTSTSFNGGSMGVAPATGDQSNPNSNRLVTLTFTGADRAAVTGLTFSAISENAFEFDNVNVVSAAVPEAATWAMFIGGFGLTGAAMRRRKVVSLTSA
jgi:hypothetical protein